MHTDWPLVRQLLSAAVDACEAAERLGLADEDRDLPTGVGPVAVADVLASAWTYAENVRYAVVRARHALGADARTSPRRRGRCARSGRYARSWSARERSPTPQRRVTRAGASAGRWRDWRLGTATTWCRSSPKRPPAAPPPNVALQATRYAGTGQHTRRPQRRLAVSRPYRRAPELWR